MWIHFSIAVLLAISLFYAGRTWLGWALPLVVIYAGWWDARVDSPVLFVSSAGLFALIALVGGIPALRQRFVTRSLLPQIAKILPQMSPSEKIAIEAGSVWWEAEFFTGAPRWRRLLDFKPRALTPREQAFLDGPCERVCHRVRDWEVTRAGDLPAEVWQLLKDEGFMGLIIPESYGGLGFSAAAHSAVVAKLASRSVPLVVSVMVPNSLGPAELLLHYGTDEQKDHYLPRLASGEEMPCFALTEPNAGSDAGSMTSSGIVEHGTHEGREVLGIRLNWDKRYITLAPVATMLGLAFRLFDPNGLLGDEEDLGITCALIPTDLPGVEVGERHDPLGTAFMNGPTHGRDVFVPLDAIIGGPANAGQGWRMLMQTLSAGRGISLPSMATGAVKLVARTVGAYGTVRKQFGMSIGKFEGIETPIARISAFAYAMEATRVLTVGAIDDGEKPAVASAVVKCYLTEAMRQATNDGMDVVGGAGISMGPRNILGVGYTGLPIGITVEGANILTRSMIIFGQGAIRCHPYVQDELMGAETKNVAQFDRAFFGHVGFVFTNCARALLLGLTGGRLAQSPVSGPTATYYKRLTRTSAAFALTADFAMATLGGSLKRKEAITGRLADALAWMYIGSATLKRFYDGGSKRAELPCVQWVLQHGLNEAQNALDGVLRNLPMRPVAWFLRPLIFPLGRRWSAPSDRLSHRIAKDVLDGGKLRETLTEGIYIPPPEELGLGQLEASLVLVCRAQEVHDRIKNATRQKSLERKPKNTLVARALAAGIISEADRTLVDEAEAARNEAVAVDSFSRRDSAKMRA